MPQNTHFVFVYGTLVNMDRMRKGARLIGQGRTLDKFALFDGGFPLAVIADESNVETGHVIGQLFEVDSSTLSGLDAYEGAPGFYKRHPTKVMLDDGTEHETEIYVGTGAKAQIPRRAAIKPSANETVVWPASGLSS